MVYKYSEVTPDELRKNTLSVSDIVPLTQSDLIVSYTKGFTYSLPSWFCFMMLYLTGSGLKVVEYLKTINIFKDTNGRTFKNNEVIDGLWEWSFHNFEESKPFFVTDRFSEKEYSLLLVERASRLRVRIISDFALEKFLNENGFTGEDYLVRVRKHRPEFYKSFKGKYSDAVSKQVHSMS